MKEKNRCINFIKGICCIAVILSHCSFPNKVGNLITYPLKIAVPFFFVISGYFSYQKDNRKLFDKAIHILKLLLVAEAIYVVYFWFFDRAQLERNFSGMKQILKIVFVGTLSTNNALWFLYALFWSYVSLMIINQLKLYRIFHPLSVVVLVGHVLVRSFVKEYGWYEDVYFRNFLWFGLPFVLLGSFMKKDEKKWMEFFSNKKCIAGAILGEILMVVEYLLYESQDYYIGTVITTFFVFLFAVKNPKVYISRTVEWIGDKLSMYVYILHILGMDVVVLLGNSMKISNTLIFGWLRPVLSILVTLGMSYVIDWSVRRMKQKKLWNRSQNYEQN